MEQSDAAADNWDPALTAAVKCFQVRYGLKETGIVAGATLKAMNVPAEQRLKQLSASAQRLQDVHFPFGERYVVVNIPSAAVDAVENGRTVHRYVRRASLARDRGEDQRRERQPDLDPADLDHQERDHSENAAESELSVEGENPRSRRQGQGDRSRQDRLVERESCELPLRQDSGAGNSLGSIRISSPTSSPSICTTRPLFSADYRFLSHGCVRVEGVYDLAAWLLERVERPNGGAWDKQALVQDIASGDRKEIKLAKPVPVRWVYMTGWASGDGTVHFRADVYGIDEEGAQTTAQAQPQAATR